MGHQAARLLDVEIQRITTTDTGVPLTSAPRISAPLVISSVMMRIRGCRV
jgi:hypothetical protein